MLLSRSKWRLSLQGIDVALGIGESLGNSGQKGAMRLAEDFVGKVTQVVV